MPKSCHYKWCGFCISERLELGPTVYHGPRSLGILKQAVEFVLCRSIIAMRAQNQC